MMKGRETATPCKAEKKEKVQSALLKEFNLELSSIFQE